MDYGSCDSNSQQNVESGGEYKHEERGQHFKDGIDNPINQVLFHRIPLLSLHHHDGEVGRHQAAPDRHHDGCRIGDESNDQQEHRHRYHHRAGLDSHLALDEGEIRVVIDLLQLEQFGELLYYFCHNNIVLSYSRRGLRQYEKSININIGVEHELERNANPLYPRALLGIRVEAAHDQVGDHRQKRVLTIGLVAFAGEEHALQQLFLCVDLLELGVAEVEDAGVEEDLGEDDAEGEDVLLLGVLQVVLALEGLLQEPDVDLRSDVGEGKAGRVI